MKDLDLFDLNSEAKRLKTFKKWHFKEPSLCTKEKLAEAGFYFIGTRRDPDVVKCFCCQKELDGWEENDDPWEEHRSHSSSCYFVTVDKPESEFTFEDIRNIEMDRQVNRVRILLAKKIEEFKQQAESTKESIKFIG